MIEHRVKQGLEQCVSGGRCQFMTYREFSNRFGLGNFPPSWANRYTLDAVADACKRDKNIGLDLTFLLRNKDSHYPSVIDGVLYDRSAPQQRVRARQEAQRIIDKFSPGTPNPY